MEDFQVNKTIDMAAINKKAQEAAEKVFLQEVDYFYTNYNSPYRKALREHLKYQEINFKFRLPDIVDILNKSLSAELERIANTAIATTYINEVSSVLVGYEKEMKLSEILTDLFDRMYLNSHMWHEGEVDMTAELEERSYGEFWNITLRIKGREYAITLHKVSDYKNGEWKTNGRWKVLSLPDAHFKNNVIVRKNDVEVELPYAKNILEDKVMRMAFNLMLSKTEIEMDIEELEGSLFPNVGEVEEN